MQRSLWATQPRNEGKLNEAFATSEAVVLFFSVNESRAFQGYAKMVRRARTWHGAGPHIQMTTRRQQNGARDACVCLRRCQASRTGESAEVWTAVDGTQSWGGVFEVGEPPSNRGMLPLCRDPWRATERRASAAGQVADHLGPAVWEHDAPAQPVQREQARQD